MLAESPPTHCAVIVMCTIRIYDSPAKSWSQCTKFCRLIYNCDSVRGGGEGEGGRKKKKISDVISSEKLVCAGH